MSEKNKRENSRRRGRPSLPCKCGTCKFWWPNTEQGVLEEADRRRKHKCFQNPDSCQQVSCNAAACINHKKFKPFYMVPWDSKTYIKIEAKSREELMDKVFGIASKIAGHFTKEILKEEVRSGN